MHFMSCVLLRLTRPLAELGILPFGVWPSEHAMPGRLFWEIIMIKFSGHVVNTCMCCTSSRTMCWDVASHRWTKGSVVYAQTSLGLDLENHELHMHSFSFQKSSKRQTETAWASQLTLVTHSMEINRYTQPLGVCDCNIDDKYDAADSDTIGDDHC